MIEHLQINDVVPCVHYDSDGVQAAFTFPFVVFKAADLDVWIDKGRTTSGFTVSGVGITAGGAVLFTVPPAAGCRVTLRRRMALERVSDFQTDGIIRAKTLNDELDYQVAAVQQVAEDVSRCVQRPFTSASTADLSLPDPVAGRGLKWNADGSGLENGAVDLDEVVDIVTAQANAAAQARAATDADCSAVAADRAAVGADRQATVSAATAAAADRAAVAVDRAAVTSLRTQAQQAAGDAEISARSVGARLVGRSATALTLVTGSITLTVEPAKAWVAGMPVTVFVTGQPLRAMTGTVTAYNAANGRMDMLVEDVSGTGSATDWSVVISGRRGAPGIGSGDLLAVNALGEIAALGGSARLNARANLGLAAVAASGAYADLSGKPILGTAAAAALGTGAGQVPTADQVAGLVQGVPTGSIVSYAGLSAPAGWLACDGSAVSRASYAALFAALVKSATVTISIASPGVVAWAGHGLPNGQAIVLRTTGALPTGLAVGNTYYVVNATGDTFQLSASVGGAAINTSGSQSGSHTASAAAYGDGDGSTTFNLPDLGGRMAVGAGQGSGLSNRVPGSKFGAETHTLSTAELPAHSHVLNQNGHGGGTYNPSGSYGRSGWASITSTMSGTTPIVSDNSGGGGAHNNMPPCLAVKFIIKT